MIIRYDTSTDILCIYTDWRRREKFSTDEEEVKNIFVVRDNVTDEIVGVKILDYKKNRRMNDSWLHSVSLAHLVRG